MSGKQPKDGIAASVEMHLKAYLDAHEATLLVSGLYGRVLREVEEPLFRLVMQACQGNQLRAAAVLGLNRNTLRKKIREHGLLPPKPDARKRRGS